MIALLAPVLGAIADRGGRRKQFLFAWTLLGVGATGALYFVGQGQWFARCAAVRARHHGLQRRHRVQRLAAARRREARGSRPRFRVRLLARLSRRRPAVPRQRAHGAASPRGSGSRDARRPCARRSSRGRVVAAVHDPADARRARAAARTAPAASAKPCASGFASSAPPSRTCASTAPRDVPAGVLVLHRRRQHHHQDGGELRHCRSASTPAAC